MGRTLLMTVVALATLATAHADTSFSLTFSSDSGYDGGNGTFTIPGDIPTTGLHFTHPNSSDITLDGFPVTLFAGSSGGMLGYEDGVLTSFELNGDAVSDGVEYDLSVNSLGYVSADNVYSYSLYTQESSSVSFLDSGTVKLSGPTPAAVTPEPSTLALLGTGLLGVTGVIRRKLA